MPENIDEMITKIRNNSDRENKKLAQDLTDGLSDEQKNALDKLMNDKSMLHKILNNEKVREIMNRIGGDPNGHK